MSPLNWEREAKRQRMQHQGSVPYWVDLMDLEHDEDARTGFEVMTGLRELEDLVASFRTLPSADREQQHALYRTRVSNECRRLRSLLSGRTRERFRPAIDRAEQARCEELARALPAASRPRP